MGLQGKIFTWEIARSINTWAGHRYLLFRREGRNGIINCVIISLEGKMKTISVRDLALVADYPEQINESLTW
jgi:hypothetical protein